MHGVVSELNFSLVLGDLVTSWCTFRRKEIMKSDVCNACRGFDGDHVTKTKGS